MRNNYWSCSAFADWLRGTAKLQAGTGREWRLWEQQAKTTHPVRYWIVEEGLDAVQNIVNWPADRLNDIRYYVNNRWVTRTHALTAHRRDIRPGEWCDVGNRFLPCLFNELVDFVEVEQAWHHVLWDDEARKQYHVPWWRSGWLRWRTWRCPEAGLAHLDWAAGLVMDEGWGVEPDDPNYGKPTHQALAAQEIRTLYQWWTQVYCNRPDPYDASGWSAYCDLRRDKGYHLLDLEDNTEEEKQMSDAAHEKLREIEEAYEREDEEMMIRLIRVRHGLWT
jgi:hypothetical protein